MQQLPVQIDRGVSPDRRTVVRREVALAARIKVADQPWLGCTVRNISPMGALLEFPMPVIMPKHFRLQIPNDLFEVECDLRHNDGTVAGVLFINNRSGALARYS